MRKHESPPLISRCSFEMAARMIWIPCVEQSGYLLSIMAETTHQVGVNVLAPLGRRQVHVRSTIYYLNIADTHNLLLCVR